MTDRHSYLFQGLFSLGKHPGVELLACTAILFLFEEPLSCPPLGCIALHPPQGTGFPLLINTYFLSFFFLFVHLGPHPWHMEVPRLGVGLHQSHSNARSELCLQPTPQLTATLDP